jgi:hypothetical protein
VSKLLRLPFLGFADWLDRIPEECAEGLGEESILRGYLFPSDILFFPLHMLFFLNRLVRAGIPGMSQVLRQRSTVQR